MSADLTVEVEQALPALSAAEVVTHQEAPRLGKAAVRLELAALAALLQLLAPVLNVALLELVPVQGQLAQVQNAALQLLAQVLQLLVLARERVQAALVLVHHPSRKALPP